MKKAAKWVTVLKTCICGAGRTCIFRRSNQGLIAGCLALLGGLLLASNLVQATTVEENDVLVIDQSNSRLIRVDGKTGARSVLSDFSNPSQGPGNAPHPYLVGVAVGQGQIFVSDEYAGIFSVDPRTGHRAIVTTFTAGSIVGDIFPGLAVDASGRVLANLLNFGPGRQITDSAVVRVAPSTDTSVIVTDFGPQSSSYVTDLTVDPSKADSKHPGETILVGTAGRYALHAAIYRVDPNTGQRSLLSDFADPKQGIAGFDMGCSIGLAVEHSGTILANAGGCNQGSLLLRIGAKSGNRKVISDFSNPAQGPLGQNLVGIAVLDSEHVIVGGHFPYMGNGVLFRVDLRSGNRVVFGNFADDSPGGPIGLSYIAAVPHNLGISSPPPAGSFFNPFGSMK